MKLEEGMYVRYIPTIGEYTQKISKITKTKNCLLDMCYTLDDKEEVFSSHFEDILGASHNIIDLIQVGDYVNGLRVEKSKYGELYTSYTYVGGDIGLQQETYTTFLKDYEEDDIYSIVTKEQFENMSYEVE